MLRRLLLASIVLAGGLASLPAGAIEPVFDDQAMHPQLLPRGSMEYDYALRRREKAAMPKPAAEAQQIGDALERCARIGPLSDATREKCEIRARQEAPAQKAP